MKLKTRFGRFAAFDGFDVALDGERVLLTRRGQVLRRLRLERWRHAALQARASFERLNARAHAHQVLVCTLFDVEQFLQRRRPAFLRKHATRVASVDDF